MNNSQEVEISDTAACTPPRGRETARITNSGKHLQRFHGGRDAFDSHVKIRPYPERNPTTIRQEHQAGSRVNLVLQVNCSPGQGEMRGRIETHDKRLSPRAVSRLELVRGREDERPLRPEAPGAREGPAKHAQDDTPMPRRHRPELVIAVAVEARATQARRTSAANRAARSSARRWVRFMTA